MAKDKLSAEQQEIVRAQNDALLRLPANADDRLKLIHNYRVEKAKENDLIAQAKRDIGSSETLKRLTSAHGLKPQAIKFINVLSEMAPPDRSAALRQVINHGEDAGWIIPDLFDKGAIGAAAGDTGGAVFDQTRTGQSQGGTAAQPRTVAEMAASNGGPAPTPGLDLSTPEARAEVIAKFEAAAAARKGQRGPKPPEFKELQANAEAAKKAEEAAKAGTGTETPPAPPEGGNVVPFAQQQREANAAGDQMARGQKPDERKPETAPEPEKKKRPSRAKSKDDAPPPPPEQEAGAETPPPPPGDDDDDGPDFRSAPVGAHQIGDQASTYTVR